jgi:hypothetical protein
VTDREAGTRGAGSRTLRAGEGRKRKPFASQPPNYLGPRRTDRPYPRRDRAAAALRMIVVVVSDDELDALFLAALAEDSEDER